MGRGDSLSQRLGGLAEGEALDPHPLPHQMLQEDVLEKDQVLQDPQRGTPSQRPLGLFKVMNCHEYSRELVGALCPGVPIA